MQPIERNAILIGIPLIILALAYYWFVYSVYSHRYRLTIEVETPYGLKTGSSVIESRGIKQSTYGGLQRGITTKLFGDAVFVDLGNGKNLFGLLASGINPQGTSAPVTLAMEAFGLRNCRKGPNCPRCEGNMCDWREIAWMSGRRDLPPDLIPSMATFSDLTDPKTAKLVKPDQFEQVFGPGYRFKRAWIELTSEPVTHGIENRLPWLIGFKGVTGGMEWNREDQSKNLNYSHFMR